MARALSLVDANVEKAPIVVRLSGHVQTNDRLAIREMGRQIAEAEGTKPVDDEAEEGEEGAGGEAEVSSCILSVESLLHHINRSGVCADDVTIPPTRSAHGSFPTGYHHHLGRV